jgi:hypothetical protein
MRDTVILRVVSGRVPAGQLEAVVEAYRQHYAPVARRTAGLDRYAVGVRTIDDGTGELAALTLWSTVEAALAAYGGSLTAIRTIDGRGHGETLDRVDYYEVDAGGARRLPGATLHLRFTAGVVARGLDADIQRELRGRLPDLPPEAIEAFVGRRVLGADVEIAFVSMWSGAPDGIALDGPLWPSISDRYDRFRIALHEVVLEGSGAV